MGFCMKNKRNNRWYAVSVSCCSSEMHMRRNLSDNDLDELDSGSRITTYILRNLDLTYTDMNSN
jgi:hypothetical protein